MIEKHHVKVEDGTELLRVNDSLEFIDVPMNAWGVTNKDNVSTILRTIGLGGCIAVTIWDPESSTTGMVHIRASKNTVLSHREIDVDFLEVYKAMTKYGAPSRVIDRSNIKLRVIIENSNTDYDLIVERISALGFNMENVSIVSGIQHVAIDSKTGELAQIVNVLPTETLTPYEILRRQARFSIGDARATEDPRGLR